MKLKGKSLKLSWRC